MTVSEISDPLAVSDPPIIDSPPLIVELAVTVNPPPEMTKGSSDVMLFTDSTFELLIHLCSKAFVDTQKQFEGGPIMVVLISRANFLIVGARAFVDSVRFVIGFLS